jgi:hypothetical protein
MTFGNIQSLSQDSVALQTYALIVTFERSLTTRRVRNPRTRIASNFFLLPLAVARNDNLERTRSVLLASGRSVTCLFAWVTARLLGLATLLLAVLLSIFTLTRLVACLSTGMGSALEELATHEPAETVTTPARLILQRLFSALTLLLRQEWAFGTINIVHMAVMSHHRMTTIGGTATRERAWRWLRTTR